MRKDAHTSFTRTYKWIVEKLGFEVIDEEEVPVTELVLSPGQEYNITYRVKADLDPAFTNGYEDTDHKATGTITVRNPAGAPGSMMVNVSDSVNGTAATVDCNPDMDGNQTSLTLDPGESAECAYMVNLPDGTNRTNTATVIFRSYPFTATADVDFTFADVTEKDKCATWSDSHLDFPNSGYMDGSLGPICVDGEGGAPQPPVTHEYPWTIEAPGECGEFTVENTVTLITEDTQTVVDDTWTINVDVPCLGCTLTPGYWKTHSEYGPAPYDDTWALLADGADTSFFLSGQTYYQVLWTPPKKGNAYYILAHAYIAAELNFLNGADPTAVQGAFEDATILFQNWTPDEVVELKGKNGKETRDEFIRLAEILDEYNNGLTGPGHCDEDSSSEKSE